MVPDLILGRVSDDDLSHLPAQEALQLGEVSERSDTATIIVREGNSLVGYACFGFDDDDMVTVYAARSVNSFLAKAAMKAFLGVSQIVGQPLRVHSEKVAAMGRMMGADFAMMARDMDGLPMGIFSRGQ